MSVERDAEHGDGQQEGEVHAGAALLVVAFVDAPDDGGCQQGDVDDHAGVERHSEGVDEQQFEPAAHFYDAGYDAVEHRCHQYHRSGECQQGAFSVGARHFLVVVYQYDGRQAEQVEQVHTDAEACEISDEDDPAVAVRLVGNVFPLQYQPEYDGGEHRGVGIYFSFDGREPECVAECIGQCAYQSGTHDGDQLSACEDVLVRDDEFADQVRDAPEEEQDAGAAHQRTHVVDHFGYQCRVVDELREKVGREHEEGCSGGVSYFQFIGGSDKFRAVPETGCGLYRHAIDGSGDQEGDPTHEVVYGFVLFHSDYS